MVIPFICGLLKALSSAGHAAGPVAMHHISVHTACLPAAWLHLAKLTLTDTQHREDEREASAAACRKRLLCADTSCSQHCFDSMLPPRCVSCAYESSASGSGFVGCICKTHDLKRHSLAALRARCSQSLSVTSVRASLPPSQNNRSPCAMLETRY
jgi:hypothetical protein